MADLIFFSIVTFFIVSLTFTFLFFFKLAQNRNSVFKFYAETFSITSKKLIQQKQKNNILILSNSLIQFKRNYILSKVFKVFAIILFVLNTIMLFSRFDISIFLISDAFMFLFLSVYFTFYRKLNAISYHFNSYSSENDSSHSALSATAIPQSIFITIDNNLKKLIISLYMLTLCLCLFSMFTYLIV
ncbi:hypothetical protein DOK67_0001007 [Enterococcus sp. DIV0212c]|uniref:hypothetical protein n=1 Tax=Enterococcus sp. DIV0212c TaxID=2230867 RepID=UPI001A9BD208|nr:hypothetical protein [Enterococcus sp. DIV0212c]MBO1352707.1 hypothetical protein [Enterococcus sp. DIV0212c]